MTGRYARHGPTASRYCFAITRAVCATCPKSCATQVASHSTYHRGQVNARLREVGGTPPLVDYIAWIWFGRPAPNWSSAPATV